MFRPLAINIGLRYAHSRRSFVSFISVVAILGLILSVAVLLLVTSVMNGFERELKQRILGVVPHVTLRGRAPLDDFPRIAAALEGVDGIVGAAPFSEGTALVAANGATAGIGIIGVNPALEGRVSDLPRYVAQGSLAALVDGRFGVVIGRPIAERLHLAIGDRVTAILPEGTVTLIGLVPREKRLVVVGIFDTHSELDARAAYVSLGDAGRLFRLGDAFEGVDLRVQDLFRATDVAEAAVDRLGADRVYGVTWMREHGNLYHAIGFQRAMMFLLLSLLVAVAAFNLISALVMVVNQRRGDIAVLRTLGGDARTIVSAFVTLGGVIGVAGVSVGVLLGSLAAAIVERGFHWLESSFGVKLMAQYFITYLPSELRAGDVVLVAVIAMALCLASAVYPAARAAMLEPADVLRHE